MRVCEWEWQLIAGEIRRYHSLTPARLGREWHLYLVAPSRFPMRLLME